MRRFDNLRTGNWEPKFIQVDSVQEAADCINWVHADYPKFVGRTRDAIPTATGAKYISTDRLSVVHSEIFEGEWVFAGLIRRGNVRVGNHQPPDWQQVTKLLRELQFHTRIATLNDLYDWYADFETIHPFQDGNGRVGGVIVAAYSKELTGDCHVPDEGWSTK